MTHQLRRHDRELREWVYRADSPIHGRGLFARRTIKAGDYIRTYWGPQAKRNGTYVLWVYEQEGAPPTGRSGRNLLRYLNHAKPGNAEFDGYDLYARVAIGIDQEITFDYRESEGLN